MSNLSKFTNFLVKAKQNTYCSGGKKEKSSRPNSNDYAFKLYDYYYLDSYLGNKEFIGEEIIWQNENVFWGMNYNGKLLVEDSPHGFSKFLKEALKNVNEDSPFRGPAKFENNNFTYECNWNGDIQFFNGSETVKHNGLEVFKLNFHGGFLK